VLTALELEQARTDAAGTFGSTAVRLAATSTSDGQGGSRDTYAATGSAFSCRLEANARRTNEDDAGGARRASSRWRLLMLPADAAAFAPADRVTVDGELTFHVKAAFAGESESVVGMLDLELVEGA
jgi:hypothetical protein